MEELDQLELDVNELLQGMEELDQLDLNMDDRLQVMEELSQLKLTVDAERVAIGDGGAAGDGGPQPHPVAEARYPVAELEQRGLRSIRGWRISS
jgi:hypothetical protein